MIYLIYTAIIVEIIVAAIGIIAIVKFDKKINKLNEKSVENRYKIKLLTQKIKHYVNNLCNAVKCCGERIANKRNNFLLKIVKKFIITTGLKILLKKYKKQLLIAELILIAYETIENSIKA
ncbi:hypothetical protein IJ818_07760 [bacterium]|nr:hypothetical protein [bacterium]